MSSKELIKEFLVESLENLSLINDQLTKLENSPDNYELVNAIYRTVHTMKGSAGFLGYKKLNDLTHNAENLLDMVREKKIKVSSNLVDVLFGVFDICNEIVRKIEDSGEEGDRDVTKLTEKLKKFIEKESKLKSISNEDQELNKLINDHMNEKGSLNFEAMGISQAAYESLKEQVDSGDLPQSVLDELHQNAKPDSTPVKNEIAQSNKNQDNESNSISQAALDSLREQVAQGVIDQSVLDELENEMKKEVQAPKETVKKIEKVAAEKIGQKVEEVQVEDNFNFEVKELTNIQDNKEEKKKTIADSFVRVNVQVLDKIMNVVGELVLNRNQIVQHSNHLKNGELTRLSQQLNVITSELQSEVMSTRMQPLGNVLSMFERLVRDLSKDFKKKIQLKIVGQETELDKSLIEAIKDPLVHIVRNACDHGLETEAERQKSKKNPTGIIEIRAYNESGQVIIEIKDDGRGLKKEKIINKAIEKNLITPEKASSLNDNQIFNLIFQPGFSTAEKVTNISGRGVGMDVVKTNIEKIGGSVIISSIENEGTTFRLKIPLTLAIVPALIIRSQGELFSIPQVNLVELVRLEVQDQNKLQTIKGTEFLKLRGNLTPIFRINKLLDLKKTHEKTEKMLSHVDQERISWKSKQSATSAVKSDDGLSIVIMSSENRIFGIVVDEIMDTEEIVVKPLNNMLNNIGVFGGATIMGDGRVALIIDAQGFLNHFTGSKEKKISEIQKQEQENVNMSEIHENLLFRLEDDRIYAVPLGLVSRLEEFSIKKVEKTGNQPVIRYLNAAMPLIDIENSLKLTAESQLKLRKAEKLPCIVTNIRSKNYGVIVKEILDIHIDHTEIDSAAVDRKGIIGTMFVGEKTVSMVDLYEIINMQNIGKANSKLTLQKKKNKTILLIDDSVMYRKLEGDALIEEGYQVLFATNGAEGLKILEGHANEIDLIVTDIEMPTLNGFEFAKEVRSNKIYNSKKIIALSTKVASADLLKGKESGFDYHLEKFKKDEVVELINSLV